MKENELKNHSNTSLLRHASLPYFLVIIGLVGISVLVANYFLRERVYRNNLLRETFMYVQEDITNFHLWLDEYLVGDENVDLEENSRRLIHAMEDLTLVLDGGLRDGEYIRPIGDKLLYEDAAGISPLISRLGELAEERLLDSRTGREGAELDRAFDEIYKRILIRTIRVSTGLEDQTAKYHKTARRVFWIMLLLWSGVILFSAIGLSIMERRRRRDSLALVDNEEKFRLLTENLSEVVYRADPESFETTYISSAIEEVYGYSAGEWLADRSLWTKTIHPEDRQWVFQQLDEALKKKENLTVEFRIIRKDGSIRWVADHKTLQLDSGGKVASINGVLHDITKRTEAAEALRDSEERYRSLFENSAEAVVIFDVESMRYEDANRSALALFGYSAYEFRKLTPLDISAEKQKTASVIENIRQGIPGSETVPKRIFVRKGRTEFQGEIRIGTFFSGGKRKAISSIRDITERIKAEEKLKELNAQLQRLIVEMTSLEERERKRFAEMLHEGIGQHLVAIKFAFAASMRWTSTEMKQSFIQAQLLLDDAIRSTRTMTAELYPSFLDDSDLSDALKWFSRQVMKPSGMDIGLTLEEVGPLSEEEKKNIFRIVRESFQNTRKHAGAKKFDLRLTGADGGLRVFIWDDGKGFTLEEARVSEERGVGLLLMKQWAGAIGATLEIISAPGEGTRIEIELPALKGAD